MAVEYRIIRYTTKTDMQMLNQLDQSLALGVHKILNGEGTITVESIDPENVSKEAESILSEVEPTGVLGCITARQLRKLKQQNERFEND